MAHVATQRGLTECPQPTICRTLSPSHHAIGSRRASTADSDELYRTETTPRVGTPRWPHTGGETTQSHQNPYDVMSARRSDFRLPAMASLPLATHQKLLI